MSPSRVYGAGDLDDREEGLFASADMGTEETMANVVRTGWEDFFYLSYQVAASIPSTGTWGVADNGIAAKGPSAGKCGLLLNNHPSFDIGKAIDFQEKTTGMAQNRQDAGLLYEYTPGKAAPKVQLEMGMTDQRLAILCWLLFQKGASEHATNGDKTFVVPTSGKSGCSVYAAIGRSLGLKTTAYGQAMYGAIVNQLQISAVPGERVKLTADFIGKIFATNIDHTNSDAGIETDGEELFSGLTWTVQGASVTSYLESFDLTINNNAAMRFAAQLSPSMFILQRFAINGTIKLAMSADTGTGDNSQIDRFVAGTPTALRGLKGASASANYFSITVNALYTGSSVDPAEELLLNLPYDGVYDGSTSAVSIIVNDGIDRDIP